MRAKVITVLSLVTLGATGALAQTTGETPADPKLEQNAPSADPALPAGEPKARMPMRRELPIVPDPTAKGGAGAGTSSEGAGAGTSGSGAGAGTSGSAAPSAADPGTSGAAAPSATEPGASGAAAPSATDPAQKEEKKY